RRYVDYPVRRRRPGPDPRRVHLPVFTHRARGPRHRRQRRGLGRHDTGPHRSRPAPRQARNTRDRRSRPASAVRDRSVGVRGRGERFAEVGAPVGLTMVHPIAAGDMYGIRGIDHVARPGLLSRVIAGSYPSGPSSAEAPLIWQMIEGEEVEAYNFPSGVIFQMHRAGSTGQPGVLTKVGLDTFVDPRRDGGRMNKATREDMVEATRFR